MVSAPRPSSPPVRRITATKDEEDNAMEYGFPSSHTLNTVCLSGYGNLLAVCFISMELNRKQMFCHVVSTVILGNLGTCYTTFWPIMEVMPLQKYLVSQQWSVCSLALLDSVNLSCCIVYF